MKNSISSILHILVSMFSFVLLTNCENPSYENLTKIEKERSESVTFELDRLEAAIQTVDHKTEAHKLILESMEIETRVLRSYEALKAGSTTVNEREVASQHIRDMEDFEDKVIETRKRWLSEKSRL